MSDRILLGIDMINMRFKYSDMDTVSDVEYPILAKRIRSPIRSKKYPAFTPSNDARCCAGLLDEWCGHM